MSDSPTPAYSVLVAQLAATEPGVSPESQALGLLAALVDAGLSIRFEQPDAAIGTTVSTGPGEYIEVSPSLMSDDVIVFAKVEGEVDTLVEGVVPIPVRALPKVIAALSAHYAERCGR